MQYYLSSKNIFAAATSNDVFRPSTQKKRITAKQ